MQLLVEASRRAPNLWVKPDVLDLLEMILGVRADEAARTDTFDWSQELQPEVLLLVARHWLDLGQLTVDERAALGVPPAPSHAEVFTQAVVAGMIEALRAVGHDAQPLLERLGV